MAWPSLWRSRTGWGFATVYLVAALFLFHYAMTCHDWMCDLAAVPVFFPGGLIPWLPFSGRFDYVPDPMRRWAFVIPAVLLNLGIYYLIGFAIGAGGRKLYRRLFGRN